MADKRVVSNRQRVIEAVIGITIAILFYVFMIAGGGPHWYQDTPDMEYTGQTEGR